jgi:hypothetical protein
MRPKQLNSGLLRLEGNAASFSFNPEGGCE